MRQITGTVGRFSVIPVGYPRLISVDQDSVAKVLLQSGRKMLVIRLGALVLVLYNFSTFCGAVVLCFGIFALWKYRVVALVHQKWNAIWQSLRGYLSKTSKSKVDKFLHSSTGYWHQNTRSLDLWITRSRKSGCQGISKSTLWWKNASRGILGQIHQLPTTEHQITGSLNHWTTGSLEH